MTASKQILSLLHDLSRDVRKLTEPRKEIFSVEEASEYLGITKQYLYELNMKNRIPHYKINGTKLVKYRKSDLDMWVKKFKVRSKEENDSTAEIKLSTKKSK